MIIEDCQSDLCSLFNCMNASDYETIVLRDPNNSEEIFGIVQYLLPDVILVDLTEKELGAKEICGILQKNDDTSVIPVVIISDNSDIRNKIECFRNGAADYICKPFDNDELLARLNTHLNLFGHKKHLMQAIKEKEKQISIVAHDLRNLFNGVFGLLGILNDNYDRFCDDERKMYINYAKSSSEKLFRFVDRIIEWALANSGFRSLRPEIIKVAELADSIKSLMYNVSKNKRIELKNEISKDLVAINDKAILSTVLRNLLGNALKFTPEDGTVLLTAEAREEMILIHVCDTGLGINADIVDRIMAGESPGSTLGTNSEKGHGLGLVICKDLIEKCGGRLSVKSAKGEGSKFTVYLPLQLDMAV